MSTHANSSSQPGRLRSDSHERERLRELQNCDILDTDYEPAFDNLTKLAASLLGTPIALVSLVDEDRQWFKSHFGLGARETPRSQAFCDYAIAGEDVLVIPDATKDDRTRCNPLVTGEPSIRAYAGAPLRLPSGKAIGTLCAIDTEPRSFSAEDLRTLEDLAAQVVHLIQLRQQALEYDTVATELRTILDSVPALIYFKDGANNILNLNKAAAAAMRLDVDEVVGRHSEEFFPQKDARKFLEDDLEVLETGRPKLGIEETHEGGDGEPLTIRTDKIPLRNRSGTFDRLVAIATDVTALRAAESQLDETNQRLALAMQGSGQAAWEWNPVTGETFLSDSWYEMLGYEKGDFASVFDGWTLLVHPEDVPDARKNLEEHLAGERPLYDTTMRVRRKDGTWQWGHVIGRVVERTSAGEPQRVTGMLIDIDGERQLQDELRQKNVELERFVYTASHDLKSPIVTILGFLSYLIKDAEEGNFDDVAGYAQRIERAANRMRANIDGLLEMSRIGRTKSAVTGVSLQEVIHDVAEDFEQRLDEGGIDLSVNIGEEVVACDRMHLTQAISNLVSNAIKYGSASEQPRIEISSSTKNDRTVEIVVSDNGTGIDPKYEHKIFDLFERLSADKNGTGIGLTIVRRVAEQYGGRVWLDSTCSEGATFRLMLPSFGSAKPAREVVGHE
ncbi:MAG: PAS domain S-box protein [Phycisphaerales bacterium]